MDSGNVTVKSIFRSRINIELARDCGRLRLVEEIKDTVDDESTRNNSLYQEVLNQPESSFKKEATTYLEKQASCYGQLHDVMEKTAHKVKVNKRAKREDAQGILDNNKGSGGVVMVW